MIKARFGVFLMDSELIHRYFEKAAALVLASAGVESVERQALHLIASEAERYARALGSNASRLAEAARRSQCTVADIEAAAVLVGGSQAVDMTSPFTISSDLKKKLRLSVELTPVLDGPMKSEILLPQLEPGSVDAHMNVDEGTISASKTSKRTIVYPDWLQREIERKQTDSVNHIDPSTASARREPRNSDSSKPFTQSLVMAEEEAREILTKKLKIGTVGSPVHRSSKGLNS
jgi:hypothetical protein